MDRFYVNGMERLVTVVQELSRTRDLSGIQAIVRSAARELTGADGASFVLRDGDLCYYLDEDAIEPLWKGQRFPMSTCISGWCMQTGQPAIIEDIYSDERIPVDAYRPTFVRSLVMVPVRTQSPIAAIGNYWATRRFPTDVEVKLLQALADSTSVALENAALYAELQTRIQERSAALDVATRAEAEARRQLAERERMEEALQATAHQLRQSQKMEAVGQLAGGVAHDFNNILTVVLSFSRLVSDDLPLGHRLRNDVDQIYIAGQRAAALTSRLLAFSRQQVLAPQTLDIGEVARGMEVMLRRLVGSHMQLEVNTENDLCLVYADMAQLEQVLLNLVVNARDAMPTGGKLTIRTSNVYLEQNCLGSHAVVSNGDYVLLAVSDTGVGMDQATQSRIFEPFFTTKEKGKGTGLGLSTVWDIVKECNGHIGVHSEPGTGTTFKVYLPKYTGAIDALQRSAPLATRVGGPETILLVEDDDQVRLAVSGILKRSGYSVLEARTPAEAMATYATHPAFQLLLTDVILPQMTGPQLMNELRSAHPALKTLCMSGFTGEAAVRSGLVGSDIPFVQKPLTPEALLLKVRQVLDSANSK